MMRPTITLALLLLFLLPLRAQDDKLKLKIRLLPTPENGDKRPPVTALPLGERTVLVMRSPENNDLIQHYGKQAPRFELYDRAKMNLMRGQDPVLKTRAGELFLEQLVIFSGDPIMLAARRDTVQGVVELYWQRLDPNLTRPHGQFEKLCAFDTRTWGDGRKVPSGQGHRDRFHASLSPDGQHLLIHAPGIAANDGDLMRPMAMVGPGMQLLWYQTLQIEGMAPLVAAQASNDGTAYRLERQRFKPADPAKDSTTYRLKLLRVDAEGAEEMAFGLEKDRHVKSAVMRPLPDGRIALAGLYGGINARGEKLMGEFLATLAPGADGPTVLAQRPYRWEGVDGRPTGGAQRMLDVLPRGDGGFFLLREFHQETDKVDARTSMAGLRWIHGPITVTSVDKDGKETWSTVFRRLLYSPDPAVGDPIALVHEGQLLLFLIDTEPQAEKRKKDHLELSHLDSKGPFTAYALFDEQGAFKTKQVLQGKEGTEYLLGDRFWPLSPNDHLGLGSIRMNGKNPQLLRLELGQ